MLGKQSFESHCLTKSVIRLSRTVRAIEGWSENCVFGHDFPQQHIYLKLCFDQMGLLILKNYVFKYPDFKFQQDFNSWWACNWAIHRRIQNLLDRIWKISVRSSADKRHAP